MLPFFMYILKCSDGSYYTGHTDDIEKRISEHKLGRVSSFTKKRRPLNVVLVQEFPSRYEALAAERQVKGWSRKKKEALIKGDWIEIQKLSQNKSKREKENNLASGVYPEFIEGTSSQPSHKASVHSRTNGKDKHY